MRWAGEVEHRYECGIFRETVVTLGSPARWSRRFLGEELIEIIQREEAMGCGVGGS